MSKALKKLDLILPGINAMMKSPQIASALQNAGNAVARSAGDGFAASTHQASFVAITNVYAETKEAKKANRDNNVLLKAVGSVGLPTAKPRL